MYLELARELGNFYTETVYWWVAVIVWGPVGPEGDQCRLISDGACQCDFKFHYLEQKFEISS